MGEVYQARDTKLDREVAIKVLPAELAHDPEGLVRFEREAKVLASLSHPNIAQIYGVEDSGSVRALVIELVPGVPLRGPLPLDVALNYARQIADALEVAHDKSIIHRDLKPANIMVTPEGLVKVLDFGLAAVARPSSSAPENSLTITMPATQAGMIMGTVAYMSPEQAAGKPVDKRADIWAFGVLLWEMLTGKRLFDGETISHTLADVLGAPIDFDKLPATTPRVIRDLVKRCLDRDVKARLRDIGEARVVIQKYLTKPDSDVDGSSGLQAGESVKFGKLWPTVAALFALVASALAFIHFRETPPPQQALRSSITLPEHSSIHTFALSPDGRTLVIAATVSGKRQLYLRPMDALQFQPMPFTEDGTYPFWSPDSRNIGFFAQGKLKKVAASGGPSLVLCDASNGRGGTWNRDDVIVFSPNSIAVSLQRVAAAGGVPTDVVKAQDGLYNPVFLPDGRHFLYMILGGVATQTGIYVASLDQKADGDQRGDRPAKGESNANRRILPDASSVQFAPPQRSGQPGHLLFVRQNTLMAVPFDASSAQVSGAVVPLADGVGLTSTTFYAPVSVSENGVLLYQTSGVAGGGQLAWFDRSGKQLGLVGAPGAILTPAISPDEKQVAFSRQSGTVADLWVRDLSRGTETRFTSDASMNIAPFWSPKGDRIVFESNRRGGVYNLYSKAASGSGPEELLLPSSLTDVMNQWSRDGRFIVFHRFEPKTKRDLWVLPMDGPVSDRKPIPFLQSEFEELLGQLSPDSRWMAFTSDRSGRREVYVRPFHFSTATSVGDGEADYTISIAGGAQPRWRGDGEELFFVGADGKIMAASVKSAPLAVTGAPSPFETGDPTALFEAHLANAGTNLFEYDVTSNGKRFLINTTGTEAASAPPLTVVTNWQAALKK